MCTEIDLMWKAKEKYERRQEKNGVLNQRLNLPLPFESMTARLYICVYTNMHSNMAIRQIATNLFV